MSDLIDVAISQLGYKETNGKSKFGEYFGLPYAPWCHMFASWCGIQSGNQKLVPKTAACSTGAAWFQPKKKWGSRGSYIPVRNDFVYFRHGGHVGIVEKVTGNTVHTIEGNYSNAVKRVTHSLNSTEIDGYGKVGAYISNQAVQTSDQQSGSDTLKYVKKMLGKAKSNPKNDNYLSKTVTLQKSTYKNPEIIVTIFKKSYMLHPQVQGSATVTFERKNVAGKFEFEMIKSKYRPVEGDAVSVVVGNVKFFYGYIFNISRGGQKNTISVTAYDQLRYLKNKDTYIYRKKRTDQLVRMIAKDFGLNCGKLVNTRCAITRVEDDAELFDMIGNSLTETTTVTGNMYTLYDDCGKLRLRAPWHVNDCLIDVESAQDYDYQSGIDNNTYNKIKLYYDNSKTGKREVYIAKSTKNINRWGTLQLYQKTDMPQMAKIESKMLLDQYNRKARTLSISGVYGNAKVRAGCLVPVMLDLDDIKVSNYMLVDKVTHKFGEGVYTMDLEVSGGKFDGQSESE